MTTNHAGPGKTILITGANSGLGFEASRLLALEGGRFQHIILACRSLERGNKAIAELVAATQRPASTFSVLALDTSDLSSVERAVAELVHKDITLDAAVLNAGHAVSLDPQTGRQPVTKAGVTVGFATHVLGHALLVCALTQQQRWRATGAVVVLASSEAARGVPTMGIRPADIRAMATKHHNGSLVEALLAFARGDNIKYTRFNDMKEYAGMKLIGSLWMSAMAKKMPSHVKLLSVSPGMTSGTNMASDMPAVMRFFMTKVAPIVMPMMGMMHDVTTGAKRYVDVVDAPEGRFLSGGFYASPPYKMTGVLTLQDKKVLAVLEDQEIKQAVLDTIDILTQGKATLKVS